MNNSSLMLSDPDFVTPYFVKSFKRSFLRPYKISMNFSIDLIQLGKFHTSVINVVDNHVNKIDVMLRRSYA
ncbi:hypothetical protein BpHYR1_019087 [Brachionus plicatilis]|uniref:Uncharacterized protein n=1 Tax=Brachionus plicatilis TaxID=10195 RepID=A0A3M7QKI6_BRAPC|nr:hypothetical protein BpHYR1_019087 [Brachionus plicatilis]